MIHLRRGVRGGSSLEFLSFTKGRGREEGEKEHLLADKKKNRLSTQPGSFQEAI